MVVNIRQGTFTCLGLVQKAGFPCLFETQFKDWPVVGDLPVCALAISSELRGKYWKKHLKKKRRFIGR